MRKAGRGVVEKIIKPKKPEEGRRSPKVAVAGLIRHGGATGLKGHCEGARVDGSRSLIYLHFTVFLFHRAGRGGDSALYNI